MNFFNYLVLLAFLLYSGSINYPDFDQEDLEIQPVSKSIQYWANILISTYSGCILTIMLGNSEPFTQNGGGLWIFVLLSSRLVLCY